MCFHQKLMFFVCFLENTCLNSAACFRVFFACFLMCFSTGTSGWAHRDRLWAHRDNWVGAPGQVGGRTGTSGWAHRDKWVGAPGHVGGRTGTGGGRHSPGGGRHSGSLEHFSIVRTTVGHGEKGCFFRLTDFAGTEPLKNPIFTGAQTVHSGAQRCTARCTLFGATLRAGVKC